MAPRTSYVCTLDDVQIGHLHELLDARGWAFAEAPHAHWQARLGKTGIVAYRSGKVTVQGRETEDVVQFLLEPEVLREARLGYEHVLAEQETPAMFEPHAGIDESGKGDYFGPLVVAACYVDGDSARELLRLGVMDSKRIHSDRRIADLAAGIHRVTRERLSVVAVGPQAYNRLYANFGNLNRLLAWGHARALENLLEREPACPRALSDQFGRKETVLRALQRRGRTVTLEQRPKAEADVAVAAASILARNEFVGRLEQLSVQVGMILPKGAGAAVNRAAEELVARGGKDALGSVAKLHFRTTNAVLGG
ncbi:MAG: ribonuclease HIII [Lentisphaeria bacterium]|nr:ribonuclease HIII [Lentisphaeria bacterium]